MPTIEQFDERHDILIYTTIADEFKIFAPSEEDAAEIALDVCRQKYHDRMVTRHEVVPVKGWGPPGRCYHCVSEVEHMWHDGGDYHE